jgi:hypothetical protein
MFRRNRGNGSSGPSIEHGQRIGMPSQIRRHPISDYGETMNPSFLYLFWSSCRDQLPRVFVFPFDFCNFFVG